MVHFPPQRGAARKFRRSSSRLDTLYSRVRGFSQSECKYPPRYPAPSSRLRFLAGKVGEVFAPGRGRAKGLPHGFGGRSFRAASMAGTVVLDDVELREAQRDYLDFLDDEVREAPGLETRALGASGPRRGRGRPRGSRLRRGGQRLGTFRPDLVAFLEAESVFKSDPVTFSQVQIVAGSRERQQVSSKCKPAAKTTLMTPCSLNLRGG